VVVSKPKKRKIWLRRQEMKIKMTKSLETYPFEIIYRINRKVVISRQKVRKIW
jgi:hypothetical protein